MAVVGDGALTGGMTWEALNNISHDNDRRLIIVVNDNGRSYGATIGGMARFLSSVRTRREYRRLHEGSQAVADRFGAPGRAVYRGLRGGTRGFLARFTGNEALYSNLDIKYVGPVRRSRPAAPWRRRCARPATTGPRSSCTPSPRRGTASSRPCATRPTSSTPSGASTPTTGESLDTAAGQGWTSVFAEELADLGDREPKVVAHHRGDAAAHGVCTCSSSATPTGSTTSASPSSTR